MIRVGNRRPEDGKNGVADVAEPPSGKPIAQKAPALFVKDSVTRSARALQRGELDAAFFVAAFDAADIKNLLNDPLVYGLPNISLTNFSGYGLVADPNGPG